jgi:hypothetical protein
MARAGQGERISNRRSWRGLDGTLFVRVSVLTHEKLGRLLEGEEEKSWDRTGFYQGEEKKERYSI